MTPAPIRRKPLPKWERLAKELAEELKLKAGAITIQINKGGVAALEVVSKVK